MFQNEQPFYNDEYLTWVLILLGEYMKKIKVIVKNKTLLELLESADVGDLVDLQEISLVIYRNV